MQTLSDRLELERNLTKSPNPMLFSISKHSFPNIQGQLMPMTEVISGLVTPKDKTKSNPLAKLDVRIFSKSLVSFYSLSVSLRGGSLQSQRATSIMNLQLTKKAPVIFHNLRFYDSHLIFL